MKKRMFALTLALVLALCSVLSTAGATLASTDLYKTDYATLEEANKAASALSTEIAEEGIVLLKNDGTLPLTGSEWVTVYGTLDDLAIEGMEQAGFTVYSAGSNVSAFSAADAQAWKIYGDAAIIQISGGNGGEGKTDGYMTSEIEDNKDGNGETYTYADGTEFVHAAQAYDGENYYKHPLQIKDAAEELIAYVTERYDSVIVLLTGTSPIEAGILRDNEKINAILWTGSLGESGWQGCSYGGWDAIASLLNGDVNPSGRTVDTWAYDFTANSTWANDGNSGKSFTSAADEDAYAWQNVSTTLGMRTPDGEYAVRTGHTDSDTVNNYYTVTYEEDIYYGYRYYETMAADYADYKYENAVAFPFGYGLSYTTFDWEVVGVEDSDWGKEQADWQHDGKITVKVKVTNTGDTAGKDVVEIYGHAPYINGGVEKAEVVLVGFEKTKQLRPGQSQTLTIEVNIQDLSSFDYTDANGNGAKTYELDAADGYELRVQSDSHNVKAVVALGALKSDIILSKDDYSGNEITALFSNSDIYDTLGYDPETGLNLVEEGKMTLMSRDAAKGGLKGTFPQINTAADMTRSEKYFAMVDAFADNEADSSYGEGSYYELAYGKTAASEAETDLPWVKTAADIPADWKQMANEEVQAAAKDGEGWLNFTDMKGVPYTDEKWTALMNELTYDDLVNIVSHGAYQTVAIAAINKTAGRYMDSALVVDQELTDRGFNWGDCPHAAATWNKELMYRRGIISGNIGLLSDASSMMSSGVGLTGWYAPAADLHRSPFGGRTAEYFSEDPYLSGHIAGNIVAGMASRGILCTIKHVALNENETQRQALFTYVTEQAAREVYFRAFQIVLQEYNCGALMTSYNNIGEIHSDANYNFLQRLCRDEWGWNGFQCTDAVTPMSNFFTMDTMLRAGGNLLLSNVTEETGAIKNGGNCAVSGTYDAETNTVKLADGSESPTQWYALRHAAQRILFTEANSKQSTNGIDLSTYGEKGGKMTPAKQGEFYDALIDAGVDGDIVYTVTSGTLPAGMSISINTPSAGGNGGMGGGMGGSSGGQSAPSSDLSGAILSGTPTQTGHYEFTVEARAYGWIIGTADFSIDVESAIAVSEPTDNLAVGAPFIAAVDLANAADFNAGVTYAVAEGSALPEGLTMTADGIIEGTPVVPGTYTVAIAATGTTSSTNFMNQTTTSTTTYVADCTFTVVGDAGEAVSITAVVATDTGYVVYFSNGTSTTIAK